VSNLTAVRALISALPRKELQALHKEIRGLIEASPKKTRVAAVGQKAWFAFMRHCRDTMADRFTEGMKAPEMAVVCKAIREEDEAAYTAFVEKFKAENSAPASDAEEAVASSEAEAAPLSEPEDSPKHVKRARLSPEAKAAKVAAEAEEKAAKKDEKARLKAAKELKEAEEKEAKALAKAEAKAAAKAAKEALAAQEKAVKAEARAAKSAEKKATKA
jgi:colicin import membrane protein